ncbi:hypothetical protein PF002_g10966 [Phytophthora fragariae]|uniref:Uncharacterized protein n=1 Tax=Phytophthora fragariae TaxID=53985 RepID=A0A6A3ZM77_9STRA|nr:hypothetical protein PF003_g27763 [Phytophthora fragariae]KAE8939975.1 hypothetical protein PF009_g10194 [Phytophthora fragariae]KAE9097212.1 hypothetical protein PF006_g23624 [Phytophthora fragariae]KAE9115639.1 hypothetical protein PF007_g9961 [Phytophthora fragariae]KAE9186228.1 hypothetical protein PF004_g23143 [Phytophthora fragariae]
MRSRWCSLTAFSATFASVPIQRRTVPPKGRFATMCTCICRLKLPQDLLIAYWYNATSTKSIQTLV